MASWRWHCNSSWATEGYCNSGMLRSLVLARTRLRFLRHSMVFRLRLVFWGRSSAEEPVRSYLAYSFVACAEISWRFLLFFSRLFFMRLRSMFPNSRAERLGSRQLRVHHL